MKSPRVLIAGIGNIFLGDDGFGVEVARRLSDRRWPEEVRVADFGIRGLDLAYALMDNPEVVFMIDAAPRGGPPGSLYVIEAEIGSDDAAGRFQIEPHSMDPVKVLRMAAGMGAAPARVVVIGCEPEAIAEDELAMEMSAAVRLAVDQAVSLVVRLVEQLFNDGKLPVGVRSAMQLEIQEVQDGDPVEQDGTSRHH